MAAAPRAGDTRADEPGATSAWRVSKYEPLRRYLAMQPRDTATVTLTFAEVEAILGAPLPKAAWLHGWWANMASLESAQVRAWWSAGWRVGSVTLRSSAPSVTFERR